jgi:hypothetical protein
MSQRVDGLSCAVVVDLLEEWIDGDLVGPDAVAIEAHLEGCASCSEERLLAERVRDSLRSLPELDAPPRVLDAVRSATQPRAADGLRSLFEKMAARPAPALAAAAAAVFLVLVIQPWGDRSAPQFTEEEIRQATVDTKLALAYVGNITRRAERKVRHAIDEKAVTPTMQGIARSMEWTGNAGGGLPASTSPSNNREGSS